MEVSNQEKWQANIRMDINAIISLTNQHNELIENLSKKVDSLEEIVKLNYTSRET